MEGVNNYCLITNSDIKIKGGSINIASNPVSKPYLG